MASLDPYLLLARLLVGTVVLTFASFTDWYWRRAPNILWLILGTCGLVILLLDLTLGNAPHPWPYLAIVPLVMALLYGAFHVGLIYGGADAKAVMALAVLLPFPLAGTLVATNPSLMPGWFAVVGNSLLVFLVIPLAYAALNLARRDLAFPYTLLGVRVDVDGIETRHVWPMERIEEGRRVRQLFPRRDVEITQEAEALRAAGVTRVWATPKVPFMIPLAVGFLAAFLLGDLITWLVSATGS